MAKNQLVSIVIVSFNTCELTISCIRSIYKICPNNEYEVIVVDNASKDGSVFALKKIAKKYRIRLIINKINKGFGSANNLGAKKARGKYLLLLNSDTRLTKNCIDPAVAYLQNNPSVGALGIKLIGANGNQQQNGGYAPSITNLIYWQLFIDDLPIASRLISSVHPSISFYQHDRELDWVTGAFMIMPRQIFSYLHGFDENIFMYAEELELCFRIRALGYKIKYKHDLSIIHYGGASGGSELALTMEVKNLIYFFQKHKPHWQFIAAKITFFAGCLLRWFFFGIIRGNERARRSYLTALKYIA